MLKRFSIVAACVAVFAVLTIGSFNHTASASVSASRIDELNRQITALLPSKVTGDAGRLNHKSLAGLASERLELFKELANEDPELARRSILAKHVLQTVPADLRSFFESEEEVEGELQVIAECEETDGRTLYFVDTGKEKLQVHLIGSSREEFRTGMRVSVKGNRVGDHILAEPNAMRTGEDNTESAVASAVGERKVLVLLVNFQDNSTSRPYTIEQTNDLMFNRSNPASVTNYYLEASYGQTWISGTTVGWLTLPMTSGQCDATTTIANYARQAAANAGVNLSAYSNYMYVFPNMGCSWAGWGEIGGKNTWIDGSLYLRTTAHELGHNLGLYHSRGMNCGTGVIGSNCTTTEYGHIADMIGTPGVTGNFNPYQKERLGWLNSGSSPTAITVQSSGTYTVGGLSIQDSNPKALKILKSIDSSGRKTWYYVEFRRPVGFDSFVINDANTMNGVLVTMNQEANGAENYLLDMVPGTSGWNDAALQVGSRFDDSQIGLTITPLQVSDTGAVVSISFGNAPCAPSAPTISADPTATQWIGPGTTASYNVVVTNNNTGGCQSNSFNLAATVPAGWTWTVDATSIVVSPGGSVSVRFYVTPPLSSVMGTYNVSLRATNSSNSQYALSVARSIGISQPIAVTVTTSQSAYSTNQTFSATAGVTANESPAPGIPVVFIITKPNGQIASYSATTSSSGLATMSYRLNKKHDPPGRYLVEARASATGNTSSASTTFSVR